MKKFKYQFNSQKELIQAALEVMEARINRYGITINNSGEVKERVKAFFKFKLGDEKREHFIAMFLNNQHRIITTRVLFSGTINCSSVHPRVIAQKALQLNASGLIIAHNHPSGIVEPSQDDIDITEHLMQTLKPLDIRVLDHIIVGGGQSKSFCESGIMPIV